MAKEIVPLFLETYDSIYAFNSSIDFAGSKTGLVISSPVSAISLSRVKSQYSSSQSPST